MSNEEFNRNWASHFWDLNHRGQAASRRVDPIDDPAEPLEGAVNNADAVPGLEADFHAPDSTAPVATAASRRQNSK